MRETFTLLFALMLSVAVNAQTKIQKVDASSSEKNTELTVLSPGASRHNAPQRKIEIGEGERLMGFYTGDELYYGLAFNSTGTYQVANWFDKEVIGDFVTGQIMRFRFALAYSATVYSAYIYAAKDGIPSDEPLAYISYGDGNGATLSSGWIDVELEEPITIEEGVEYLIGYEFLQGRNNYPMAIDYLLEQDVECDYFYCYDPDYGFWDTCDGYGTLLVQAVVKGGQFIDDDLALKNLSPNKFGAKDGELSYKVQIKNMGNKYPQSYKLKVAIDGVDKGELDTPIAVTSKYQSISGSVSLEGIDEGSHTLTVSVADINGEVPTENTSDDEVEGSFTVYAGEMPDRQKHLIEEFTSVQCQYCPLGAHVLETMMENNPDKYILVACHSIGMGTDTLALYQDDYLTVEYFIDLYSYPSADFDRAQLYSTILGLEGDVCCSIGYYSSDAPVVAAAFDEAIDEAFEGIPAFASVDIESEYSSDTRELKITVKGEGSEQAKELLDGNRLTIYLTEDGIEGRQYTYSETTGRSSYQDVVHDNVLRAIPTTYEWGDDIGWTSNSAYENTVTTTLPAKWDDSQIYITAFISGSMAYLQGNYWYLNDVSEGMVNNANRVKATDVPAGISAVTVNTDDVTRTYYTTDGRQLSAPVKGVNIVKSSDGTVKKLYVK